MLRSIDNGKTWSELLTVEGLRGVSRKGMRTFFDAIVFEPLGNGRFLVLVHRMAYSIAGNILDELSPTYSCIYDINTNRWGELHPVVMDFGKKFAAYSDPQIVREGDDWLIPFYLHFPDERTESFSAFHLNYKVAVLRCRVSDSGEVKVCEKSDFLSCDIPRGFCEPALCKFNGKYIMTLRNDQSGYIAASDDWRKWPAPKKLEFDNGEWLGNYNTMTKLLDLDGKLYLIYTRKGLNNDHVFRHRAPLMIAELDPQALQVIRKTEQVLVPEYGSRLSNFSVRKTSETTVCVSVAEWVELNSQEREHGADNRIWFASVTSRKGAWRATERK